ncbi:MAG: MSEP-CTERM sorting domain-containing protein [Bacteroidota bacterium]
MRSLLNPKWIFLVNTLPSLVLAFLFWSNYTIIHSLLEPENLGYWANFTMVFGAMILLNAGYAALLIRLKKKVSPIYAVLVLMAYIVLLFEFFDHSNKLYPWDLPAWMLNGDYTMHVLTFLMPTLAYGLLVMVLRATPEPEKKSATLSLIWIPVIPAFTYLFIMGFSRIRWNGGPEDSALEEFVLLIISITLTVLFFFFLVRFFYIIGNKKSLFSKETSLIAKGIFSIALPLAGLLTNAMMFGGSMSGNEGVFGNFNTYWFYGLALANGLLICLPNPKELRLRLFLFLGRSITFTYTLYFFLVFLPFTPLSIVAIIIFGLGFLMLTPTVLFVIHSNILHQDYRFLGEYYSKNALRIAFLASLLVIPGFLTGVYRYDGRMLERSLEYVYEADYDKSYQLNYASIKRTLQKVKENKSRSGDFFFKGTPYLSGYFNWLVLDNLTLSNTKIVQMEGIFLNKPAPKPRETSGWQRNFVDSVQLTDVAYEFAYDEHQQVYETKVELEMSNFSEHGRMAEFVTNFELPAGCWIKDYALFMGDRREPGILSEERTAKWVYNNIKDENKDPGILSYEGGNKIELRVFPFRRDEIRRTDITFLHKEPTTLRLSDSTEILLGKPGSLVLAKKVEIENGDTYLPAAVKNRLPLVKRTPYLHFILDMSENRQITSEWLLAAMEAFSDRQQLSDIPAKVSLTNSRVATLDMTGNWRAELEKFPRKGGFFAERALKMVLTEQVLNPTDQFPVFVLVTDNWEETLIGGSFADFAMAFPESAYFYHLNPKKEVYAHSLLAAPLDTLHQVTFATHWPAVRAYPSSKNPVAYLPDDSAASVIFSSVQTGTPKLSKPDGTWENAMEMQALWSNLQIRPHQNEEFWLSLVRASFENRIMMPVTSFIALENEAQKAALQRKQKQVLNSDPNFDLGDDNSRTRMSEPEIWWIILLIGAVVAVRVGYQKWSA